MRLVSNNSDRAIKHLVQATCLSPGAVTGADSDASNDASYRQENSVFATVVSVLANTVGGALLLSGMLGLPLVLAEFLP